MVLNNFDPQNYWEKRLAENPNLLGTGHRAFSLAYNQILYQAQIDCLDALLNKHEISVQNQTVLDVGSGTGFFVDYYLNKGARVIGLDLTEASVKFLKRNFPTCQFFQADVSEKKLPVNRSVNLVSVISVFYHIVDDLRFQRAVKNLIDIAAPQ